MADVELRQVSKTFDDTPAVSTLSLSIADGEFVVMLGPTGAGKTTTLRLIAGLETPDAGDVFIHGRCVTNETPAQRDVAMVFQQYSLYPHMTVRQNLEFPLKSPVLRSPGDEIARKVGQVAEVLHISSKLENKATELSGGEMQRVSIGRALVRDPAIYLMDEPLSSLDAKLRSELRLELKRLQSEFGSTILYVTHDQVEAMTLATRVGVLNEGRLVQIGTPREIYENPADVYVATRLGLPRLNTVPADVFPDTPNGVATIGLRPEHILLGDGQASEVTRIEHLGDQTRMHLNLAGHKLVTLVDSHTAHKVGDSVCVQPYRPLYFDRDGLRVNAGNF